MGWPVGFMVHKTAATVIVDGNPAIKQGHDIGYGIAHFAIPYNSLCIVNTLFSKHKVMFPVSTVLMQGSPAGSYLGFAGALICANPVSLPTGVCIIIQCTAMTSLSPLDIVKGIGYIALDIAADAVFNKVRKGFWLKAPKADPLKVGGKAVEEALGNLAFRKLLTGGHSGLVAKFLLEKSKSKLVDHVLKSWLPGSTIRGLFRGSVVVGRGDILSHKFFGPVW